MPLSTAGPATRLYAPRRAWESPLYKVVLDHLETLLARPPEGPDPRPAPCAEDSLRAFLECGIPRFGVARYLCRKCGQDMFVPYSCKRRLACPSCDGKRAAFESLRALEGLLPRVPYRQWVLVVPKRLRYFVHRQPRLAGELSRILAAELARFYMRRCGAAPCAAPVQFHVGQRFGSRVNLHIHVHAVVSDGVFAIEGGRLRLHPAPEPSPEEIATLSIALRRRILRRMLRLGALPEESAQELLARPRGGFSLNGEVRIGSEDRAALGRLLQYVLRPALCLKRLSYRPEEDMVRYRPKQGALDGCEVLQWRPLEFLARFARLIPPPRLHLVRSYGALGPRSNLRPAVTAAARRQVPFESLEAGLALGAITLAGQALARAVEHAASVAARSWAALLRRVFEVDPLLCPACRGPMMPVAVILDDSELTRILVHLGLPHQFPKTKPARDPPIPFGGGDSQIDPAIDAWDGRDQQPPKD